MIFVLLCVKIDREVNMLMDRLLVIDGNSMINRAFYGTQNSFMKNAEGLPTGAIFGFLTIYFKQLDELKPTHVAVAFDRKEPTFRHGMYTAYKGTRKPMPEELAAQMPVLKELLDAMQISRFELPGYEADDILGTLSRAFDGNTVILTGDRDALQLVRDNVAVMLAGNKADVLYDEAAVADNYGGLKPAQLIDLKALQGDSSDNIPGVPGVGPKTAQELISEYGSLDGVYAHLEEIPRASLKTKLTDNKSLAYLSLDLGRINTAVPLDPEAAGKDALRVRGGDPAALKAISDRLEFKRWARRLTGGQLLPGGMTETAGGFDVFTAPLPDGEGAGAPDAADNAENGDDALSLFDFASTPETGTKKELTTVDAVGFAAQIAEKRPEFVYIDYNIAREGPEDRPETEFTLYVGPELPAYRGKIAENALPEPEIQALLSDKTVKKVFFKAKPFVRECCRQGIEFRGIGGDLSLASYLLDSTRSSDDFAMVLRFLAGQGVPADCEGIRIAHLRALEKLAAAGMTELYEEIELPLAAVLARMELRGFRVDPEVLREEGREMEARIAELQAEIYGYAGYEFNINSTRQLAKVLFEDLGLKGTKKTKSGYSTDSDVLEALAEEHPIVPCVIEYRQNAKLKSTYIDGLLNVIDPATSRVHSTFNQNLTATGRLSSSEPNLQNIPVRSELGKLIRKAFVPSDADHVLIDADYSQIELRVLASMSGDPLMIANFENDLDIHTSTAAVVNRVPMDMVTPQMRSRAKAVNFGIVYGISSFGLARDLGISNYAAKQLIDNYFLHYPQIKAFMEYAVAFAKDNGYAVTLSGRRRPLPELSPANKYMTRQFGERVAMNMPVQGTAADIIKRAMINVERALEEGGYKSRLILQVHDELLIDAARDEAEAVRELLAREMENCFPLKVPLKVSVSESDVSWYYCK